jgi:hypothetical protein
VGHVIARGGGGRLFFPPEDDLQFAPVGCLDAVGAWFLLPVDVLREPLAVFGRFAVFHHELCDDSCLPRLGLVDIRRRRNLGGIDVFTCPPDCRGESDIPALAVGARGAFAWVTCTLDDRRRHCRGSWTLHVLDGRGRRRVERGTDLRSPRLRVERGGRTVVLTGGATRRAIRLRGAPRQGSGGLEPDPF